LTDTTLQPSYSGSHALIIGINAYAVASPLRYAVNDAESIATLLKEQYSFQTEHIHLLRDSEATRDAILRVFLGFARDGTGANDRVLVYFAGHGLTVPSRRGEVGFLVPHEGDPRHLSTLIRWDELTRDADLVPAKHVLFLMDACYGGLAVARTLQPGAMRFVKDMLLRPVRQVLTAGKPDEVVADHGGPLSGHSVFTGHLLEGLNGKAADRDGILTANGVMAYVYRNVSSDPDSRQSPHFGFLSGDGDFIFKAPILEGVEEDEQRDHDALFSVPAVTLPLPGEQHVTVAEQVKEFLSDERHRITLHDLAGREIRQVLSATAEDYFPVSAKWSAEEFAVRLAKYEDITKTIREIQVLIGYWGSSAFQSILTLALKRLSDRLSPQSGLSAWIALRWYPVLLLLYSGGVAAVAGGQFDNLTSLLQLPIDGEHHVGSASTILRATWSEITEMGASFKTLPGHERNLTPLSEYIFKLLQPSVDDLLFLGSEYESHFDTFEVLMSVEHADQWSRERGETAWGPYGRFSWKARRPGVSSPWHKLILEAEAKGNAWPPAKAGLFQGSAERFTWLTAQYKGLGQA